MLQSIPAPSAAAQPHDRNLTSGHVALESSSCSFVDLPSDLLRLILAHLNRDDFARARQADRALRAVSATADFPQRREQLRLALTLLDSEALNRSLQDPRTQAALQTMPTLRLPGPLSAKNLEIIFRHISGGGPGPPAQPLRSLDLSLCGYSSGYYSVLTQSPYTQHLTALCLRNTGIFGSQTFKIFTCGHFPRLLLLDYSQNHAGGHGAAGLRATCALPRLRHLDLSEQDWRPQDVQEFLSTTTLSSLISLNLAHLAYVHHRISRGIYLGALARTSALTGLMRLDLSGNEIRSPTLRQLSAAPALQHVLQLRLEHNWVGAGGARAVTQSRYLTKLTELNLSDNRIHTAGALALLGGNGLPNLRILSLARNNLNRSWAKKIVHSSENKHLNTLDLRKNHLSSYWTDRLPYMSAFCRVDQLLLNDSSVVSLRRPLGVSTGSALAL